MAKISRMLPWEKRGQAEQRILEHCRNLIYEVVLDAVSAIPLTKGYSSAKHSGIRSLFLNQAKR